MDTSDADVGHRNGSSGGAGKELNQQGKPRALQGLSVDEIMWQVRVELNRLRRGHSSFADTSSDGRRSDSSMPTWKPAVPRLVIKDTYHLSELLAFSDEDFI